MKRTLTILFLLIGIVSQSQDLSKYAKLYYVNGKDSLPYRMLLPENYDPKKKYPLILFLHGAGERGNDNEKQLMHGATLFLKDSIRKEFPAIVLFPQCPANSFWSNVDIKMDGGKRLFAFKAGGEPTIAMKLAQEMLKSIISHHNVNKKQVYVMGLSMGGMGTFEIVGRNPKLFAAAAPICGGGSPDIAPKLKKTSWWVFHGAKDDIVLPENSEIMVNALKAEKADVKYTLYPNANHNSWTPAFAEPDLLQWMFSHRK